MRAILSPIGSNNPKHQHASSGSNSMAAPMKSMGSSFNATSFQKKTRSKLISIPGTRPSVQNGQLIVSTGVTSLDYLIGQCFIKIQPVKLALAPTSPEISVILCLTLVTFLSRQFKTTNAERSSTRSA